MIPFFRQLRKQLAADNKPLNYLKYAIGEIVLVVIGILIALSINNWNEGQKRNAERISLLQNLRLDARATREYMIDLIAIRKDILKDRRHYLELAATRDPNAPLDSLFKYINWTGVKSVEKWPILTTYEGALSSGEIELIQNRELLQDYNNLQIRNQQRLKLADYHFQQELLFGTGELHRKFGSAEILFTRKPETYPPSMDETSLRQAYYDRATYAIVATEYDIWTNQVNILTRIKEINDSILERLNRQLDRKPN